MAGGYNGRLQFSMRAASFAGTTRHGHGFVEILTNSTPHVISFRLDPAFAAPSTTDWTRYSIPLREDSWLAEPSWEAVTAAQMRHVLSDVQELRIRGDSWTCDAEGDGQEAVYLNDIRLEVSPAAGF